MEHALDGDLVRMARQSLAQRRFESGQCQLVDAHRTREWMARHLLDRVGALFAATKHDPGLRPAQELVARKRDHVGVLERLRDRGLVADLLTRSAAEVVEEQEVMAPSHFAELVERGGLRKTGDSKVGGVAAYE